MGAVFFASGYSRDETEMLQRFHNGCFLFLGADARLSVAGVAIIVILMLTDTQLLTNLSDVSRVNLEAVLLLDVLLDVVIAVNLASISLQVLSIHGDTQIVADLFPT